MKKATLPPPPKSMTHAEWVEVQKQNIYHWFNNNGLNKGCGQAGKVQTIKILMPQLASRLSTKCQIYSQRYYDNCVRAFVDAEINKLGGLDKMLEVKEEVGLALEEEQKEKEASKEPDKAIINVVDKVTPEQALILEKDRKKTGPDCKKTGPAVRSFDI
ncbi:hypothetical protein B0H34DRAFT_675018 [Crassisporium funariophilum]|nr:hypothetical protein B0H34DRAFT_675018 [Crassisporium funariophilum]